MFLVCWRLDCLIIEVFDVSSGTEPWEVKMKDHSQYQRRAWALLIVLSSFVAAAAVWTLPEDGETKVSPAFRPG